MDKLLVVVLPLVPVIKIVFLHLFDSSSNISGFIVIATFPGRAVPFLPKRLTIKNDNFPIKIDIFEVKILIPPVFINIVLYLYIKLYLNFY